MGGVNIKGGRDYNGPLLNLTSLSGLRLQFILGYSRLSCVVPCGEACYNPLPKKKNSKRTTGEPLGKQFLVVFEP